MPIPKHTEPVILIILTSIAIYGLVRSKKLNYLGHHVRNHIIHPAMKVLKMKSIITRELKRETAH